MIWIDVSRSGCEYGGDRLSIAYGTRIATPDDFPGDFETGARIACGPFEVLAPESLRFGPDGACARQWNTVAVFVARPEIVQDLRDARLQITRRNVQEGRCALDRAVAAWMQSLPDEAGWRPDGPPMACGFSSEPRPRNHTTVNSSTGQRVGLHLDSWDQLPPRERWRGSNRICLNLGTAPRGFMFVPSSATGFADELLTANVNIDSDSSALRDGFGVSNLARRYLEVFPNRKIIRTLVWPGEAYIAPTENLIHDGHAPPGNDPDLSLTLRGNFVPLEGEVTGFNPLRLTPDEALLGSMP